MTKVEKITLYSLNNPEDAIGRKSFNSDNKNYLGRILSIDSKKQVCVIKTDFGKEIKRSFSDILIESYRSL